MSATVGRWPTCSATSTRCCSSSTRTGTRLFTIASHGYDAEGVGSEVAVGEGLIGMAAARGTPLRIGNLHQMNRYSRTVRRSFEGAGDLAPGHEIPVPDLPDAQSRLAVPAMALGQLVGVLVVESTEPVAFTAADEATLTVVAALVASAVEAERSRDARSSRRRARPSRDRRPTVADEARRRACGSSRSTGARSSTATT